VIVHKAEKGGFWGEVPTIAGCATQGESLEEIIELGLSHPNQWQSSHRARKKAKGCQAPHDRTSVEPHA
jgi:hypothetical protein